MKTETKKALLRTIKYLIPPFCLSERQVNVLVKEGYLKKYPAGNVGAFFSLTEKGRNFV